MEMFSKKYLAEFVYGATDGTVTTFAIIAAVSGAGLSPLIVLILGFSNVLADGFSMAVSNYLSETSEKEVMQHDHDKHPLKTAFVTFCSFVVVGSIPLLPFVFSYVIEGFSAFVVSGIATLFAFFVIGFIRGRVVGKSGIRSALETVLIGAVAAGIAYGAGAFIEQLIA